MQELEQLRSENQRLHSYAEELQEAREALKRSERRYETLTDTAPVGIFHNDAEGRLTYGNDRCTEITGYDTRDVADQGWVEVLHPEDRERVVAAWQEAVTQRKEFREEYRFCHKDGNTVWVIGQAVPELDEKGELQGFLGTMTDITDRMRMEEDIFFRMNFEHLVSSISTHFINLPYEDLDEAVIAALKEVGSFVDVDRSYVFLFSADGRLASCAYEWCNTLVAPSQDKLQDMEVANFGFSLARIQKGDDLYIPSVSELGAEAEPSKSVWEQEGIRTIVALPMVGDGQVMGVLGFDWVRQERRWSSEALDLLRLAGEILAASLLRKRSQMALRKTEDRFRAIFDSVTDAIFIHGKDGKIEDVNHAGCALFGFTHKEMIEKQVGMLSEGRPPFATENAQKYIEAAIRDRTSQLFEWHCRHASGRLWWGEVHLQVAPMGGETKVIAVVRDITRRKQSTLAQQKLQTQVQHSQKLESLGVLAGGIAHDFNNLLLGIMGNADMAMLDVPEDSPAIELLEEVISTTRRAADLCNQLLAYSGKGKFVEKAVDLSALARETVDILEVSVAKNARLHYEYAPQQPTIMADPTQVRQVIMNLITNASDALGGKTGEICVSTGSRYCDEAFWADSYLNDNLPPGQYAYCQVTDTGMGMDEETIAQVFDPFFSTKFTGRGLGLAAVLGIVRAHHGAVSVESQVGQGCTFSVFFPITKEVASTARPALEHKEKPKQSGLVMLVDDEAIILTLGKKILERGGYKVLLAKDGLEAVELFQDRHKEIVAVVLDLMMPRMSGEEALVEMRRIDPQVKVILTSGYSESETTAQFAGKGLAGFLHKPYRPANLLDKLKEVIVH